MPSNARLPTRVQIGRHVPVGGFWYVRVEFHREPGGGVPEPALYDPGVLALLDHEAGGDTAEPVEGERLVEAGPLDCRVEDPLGEVPSQPAARAGEDEVFWRRARKVSSQVSGQFVDQQGRDA